MSITPREQQIIDFYEAGLKVGEIAAQMGLSFVTVKNKVGELCTRTGRNHRYVAQMKRSSDMLRDAVLGARAVQ